MIDLRILFQLIGKLIRDFVPHVLGVTFFILAFAEDDDLIRALYLIIALLWLIVSKLDDIHTVLVQRTVTINVNNPPGITSRVEVNGKPVN